MNTQDSISGIRIDRTHLSTVLSVGGKYNGLKKKCEDKYQI